MIKRYFSVIFRNITEKVPFVTEKMKWRKKSITVRSEEKEEKRQMSFFTSSVCDLLISIAETSLSSASRLGCYQPDVRALKQQLHDRKEKNGEPKYKS